VARGAISFVPSGAFLGRHQFKFGGIFMWENGGSGFLTKESGNYLLTFNGGQPVQIATYSSPVNPTNRLNETFLFATDTWSIGSRTTLNLGVRIERYHAFYPEQTGQPGQFSAGGTTPGRHDILTWKLVVPRLAAAWDMRGNGKSVLKGTFGMYGNTCGVLYAQMYNPNALITTNYRWSDPNHNGDYDPGEVDLSPNGPDYLTAFGGINQILNENLKQPITYEYTARFEQELRSNVALSFAYVYKNIRNLYNKEGTWLTQIGVNVLRPSSLYTIPITRTDPGPDNIVGNSDDGPAFTIWDYPAQYKGAAFNGQMVVNDPPGKSTYFHTLEATFTKRYSNRWNALASFWVSKNHQWLQATPQSPNEERFPTDETWNWEGRLSTTYMFPLGIQIAGVWNARSGQYGQRTTTFRSIPQQSTVTLRMEPYGTQQGPTIKVLNMKTSKQFSVGGSRRLELTFEVFNLFNTSAATSTRYLSGPTYGFVTGVVSPRVARFGGSFKF
jgi:hypothetical protein